MMRCHPTGQTMHGSGNQSFSGVPEPPFCADRFAHLMLRLFVLRIRFKDEKGQKGDPLYQIAYGVVTRFAGTEPLASKSDFTSFAKWPAGDCALASVTVAGERIVALRVFEALCQGTSLKEVLSANDIVVPKRDFDVTFSRNARPTMALPGLGHSCGQSPKSCLTVPQIGRQISWTRSKSWHMNLVRKRDFHLTSQADGMAHTSEPWKSFCSQTERQKGSL